MKRENVLLMKLAKDCLNMYFSGLSPNQLHRAFNKAVSNYLDAADQCKFSTVLNQI